MAKGQKPEHLKNPLFALDDIIRSRPERCKTCLRGSLTNTCISFNEHSLDLHKLMQIKKKNAKRAMYYLETNFSCVNPHCFNPQKLLTNKGKKKAACQSSKRQAPDQDSNPYPSAGDRRLAGTADVQIFTSLVLSQS